MPDLYVFYPQLNDTTGIVIFNTVTYVVGMTLSAIALMMLLITAVLFKEWRRNYKNQLLVQFMISRFIYAVIGSINDIVEPFSLKDTPSWVCWYSNLYAGLVLVIWMYVFTRQMHDSLVNVFGVTEENIVTVSIITWSFPLAATSAVALISYVSSQPTTSLKCLLFYIILIKWPVIFANGALLSLILSSLINNNIRKPKSNRWIVFVMSLMIFVFCVQQVAADVHKTLLMSYLFFDETVPLWLSRAFSAFNGLSLYYCPVSISFWLFGNRKTRDLWTFKRKRTLHRLESRISYIPM